MSRDQYSKQLQRRISEGRFRKYVIDARHLVDFSSNDYLGFARSDEHFALSDFGEGSLGLGAGAARLITGNSKEAEELEQLIATFHRSQSALLAPTGYTANLSVMSTLAGRGDLIIFDEYVHASIRDGIQLSHAKSKKCRHNDVAQLEELLKSANKECLVVIESVYSMRGDVAPILEYVELCDRYGARLIVDEAHAVGVYGPSGEGLVVALEQEDNVFCRIVTFGKSLGCFGAAILSGELVRDYLVNFARPLIYSTFVPPVVVQLIKAQYHRLFNSSAERKALFDNIEYFEQLAHELGISQEASQGAIRSLTLGDAQKARELSSELKSRGYLAKAICSPTVPLGSEMLRVVLHSYNTKEEIGDLLRTLIELRPYGEENFRNRHRHGSR